MEARGKGVPERLIPVLPPSHEPGPDCRHPPHRPPGPVEESILDEANSKAPPVK